jgi:hypothetical protein
VIRRLRARRREPAAPGLGELKLRAIDHAFERLGARTVADLGGVWAVDGGYTLYALDRHEADHGLIYDDDFTPPLIERERGDARLELAEGNFGRPEAPERIGEVDALLLFDVLLHQVDPDWDEILRMYAPATSAFVLSGPWWNGGDETVRLVELGRERYLEAVPLPDLHAEIWEKLDAYNPRRDRLWRDCHDIWQWGIPEAALRSAMTELGFELSHREQGGPWMGLADFDDIAFVFTRG